MRIAIMIALIAVLLLLWAVLYAQPIAVPSPGPQWFPHGIKCPVGVPCGSATAAPAAGPNGIGGNTANTPGSDGIVNVKNYGAKGDGHVYADGTMPTGPYSFGCSPNCYASGFTLAYRNVNATPVDVSGKATGSGNMAAPSVTTTVANDVVVAAYSQDNGGTVTAAASPFTERAIHAYLGSAYMGSMGGDQPKASPGATGTITATLGNPGRPWAAMTIALKPAAGQTIGYVGSALGATNGGNKANINLSDPPGVQSGDTLVACLATYPAETITPPAGFTLIDSIENAGGDPGIYCYTHVTTLAANNGITLTSASATFTSADAGKLICVNGASADGTELCGTISAQVSANSVNLSFANENVAAISSKEFAYATNDDAAFSTGLAAACGKELFVPAGIYGRTTNDIWCTTQNIIMQGAGGGQTSYQPGGTGTIYGGNVPATSLLWLTKAMTANTAAETIGNGITTAAQDQAYYACCAPTIRDIAFQATLGNNYDGGGATVMGIHTIFGGHVRFDDISVVGFSGDCVRMDNVWVASMNNSRIMQCGARGLAVMSGQQFDLQNTDVSINGTTGLVIGTTGYDIIDDIIQWNSRASAAYWEADLTTGVKGFITGTWFEQAAGSQGIFKPGGGNAGIAWGNNGETTTNNPIVQFSGSGANALPTCSAVYEHGPPQCAIDAAACTSGTTYAAGGGAVQCLVQCFAAAGCTAAGTPESCCTGNGTGCGWVETGAGCY